jgi:hypothetical protein
MMMSMLTLDCALMDIFAQRTRWSETPMLTFVNWDTSVTRIAQVNKHVLMIQFQNNTKMRKEHLNARIAQQVTNVRKLLSLFVTPKTSLHRTIALETTVLQLFALRPSTTSKTSQMT